MDVRKSLIGAGLAATAFAGGVVGGVMGPLSAGADDTTDTSATASIDASAVDAVAFLQDATPVQDDAVDPSVAPDEVESERHEERTQLLSDTLGELVTEGVLTQDQADAVAERLTTRFEENRGDFSGEGLRGHFGHGRDGFRSDGGFGSDGGFFGSKGLSPDVILDALGMTAEELRTAIVDGESVGDIAEAAGIDLQSIVDQLVAEATARLQAKVDDGTITQERADEAVATLTERITEAMNTPFGARLGHGPR